jgi:hypothetical protein
MNIISIINNRIKSIDAEIACGSELNTEWRMGKKEALLELKNELIKQDNDKIVTFAIAGWIFKLEKKKKC